MLSSEHSRQQFEWLITKTQKLLTQVEKAWQISSASIEKARLGSYRAQVESDIVSLEKRRDDPQLQDSALDTIDYTLLDRFFYDRYHLMLQDLKNITVRTEFNTRGGAALSNNNIENEGGFNQFGGSNRDITYNDQRQYFYGISFSQVGDNELRQHVQAYLSALNKQFLNQKKVVTQAIQLQTQEGSNRPKEDFDPLEAILSEIGYQKPQINPRYAPNPKAPLTTIEEFFEKNGRVALLGDPGAGKSTTLRRLVQRYGRPWFEKDNQPLYIPIFIALNLWQDSKLGLIEFVCQQVQLLAPQLAQQLPTLIIKGKALLLLDGLNELPKLKHDDKTGQIEDPRCHSIAQDAVQCIVSCRIKEFEGGLDWHDLYLLPLQRIDIEAYATAYYRDYPGYKDYPLRLTAALFESKNENAIKLQAHARNPFYLQYLVAFFVKEGGQLPPNPARLLEYSVNKAFEREIEAGRITMEETTTLKKCLTRLAFNMTDAGQVGSRNLNLTAEWLFHQRLRQNGVQRRRIMVHHKPKKNRPEEVSEARQLLSKAERV